VFTRDAAGVYAANTRQVHAALQSCINADLGLVDLDDDEYASLELFDAAELAMLEELEVVEVPRAR